MGRRLRYSERKAVAEAGGLGALQDSPSEGLRNALVHLLAEAERTPAGRQFRPALHDECVKYFGWPPEQMSVEIGLLHFPVEEFLDLIELFCEKAIEGYKVGTGIHWQWGHVLPEPEAELNGLFDRHRFGYRLRDGEIRKVGSPVLDEVVVGPALLAVQRQGWEEVERSFREAIHHQRGDQSENDDALTAANAAVEAALKAAGFKGANLGPLARDFKASSLMPPELRGVPEALDALLKRLGALRSSHGDSHGKTSGAEPVPQELVDLSIHWAGAFIVYLSQTVQGD
jgi:hypothetical protein